VILVRSSSRSFRRRTPPIGAAPIAGPADPIGLRVELYLGALGWTDISPYVLYRDSTQRITITRGRPNETSQIQPQTAAFQVNNRDGRFSPRNPAGPYWGLIGRNTPVRISRLQNGVRRYRFHGEVVSWPTVWDISGSDVWVDVSAAGMLRRLQQGTSSLQSAMRSYTPTSTALTAYWPCEDGPGALQLASAFPGGKPMSIAGNPDLASYSGFVCSSPIPTLRTDTWQGVVTNPSTSSTTAVKFLFYVPASTLADGSRIISANTGGGAIGRIDLKYRTGGLLQVQVYAPANATAIADSGATLLGAGADASLVELTVLWTAAGADTNVFFLVQAVGSSALPLGLAVASGVHAGGLLSVVVAPDGTMGGASIGQIKTLDINVLGDVALNAYIGEDPLARLLRLASQVNADVVPVDYGVSRTDSVTMGYQTVDTFANLAQQVPDADAGMLYESADQLALAYRVRPSLYNQGTVYNARRGLTLDYAQAQLSGPLGPVDDDAYTRNDVTVQRLNGSSLEAALAAGALSTQQPPAGVGGYATTYSLSVGLDAQLPDHAHWRLHLGTVDEPRYPQVMLNLRHPQFTGNVDLLNEALVMDIGDLVVVNNPPAWMPPDAIRQILQGYTETLGVFEHDMVLNCSPEAPYRVGMVGDAVLGVVDTDGSTLAAPLGPALNPNPFFAGGSLAGWSATNAAAAIAGTSGSASPLPAGGPTGYGALLTPSGSGAVNFASGSFPVSALQTYYVSALLYSPNGNGAFKLGFDWRDSGGVFLSSSLTNVVLAAAVWTAAAFSASAPANAVSGMVHTGQGGTPAASDTAYVACAVAWQGAVSVASTNILLPLWTTSAGAFPFDIGVSPLGSGGERMTVTGITGGASPQAFTVARGVNGTIVPQPTGADVRLWQPCYASL